jgi:hypothetical protein
VTAFRHLVWDALDERGYGPHGQSQDFRARCPGHDGENPSALHVTITPDGTVLLNCFAHGCSPEEIVDRLGLRVRDLFPLDPGDSRRRLRTARCEDFSGNARTAANVLLALERVGARWRVSIQMDECANCEWPRALLVIDSAGEPFVHCPSGCEPRMITQALADRMTGRRRAA